MADLVTSRTFRNGASLLTVRVMALAAAFICIFMLSVAGQERRREWTDYAGGPAGSRFVDSTQLTRANVKNLSIAWSYPYGETGFNPIVARGVVYTKARNSSLVALDAATGKEIWIHEGLQGLAARGMNYWESADGRDRRLLITIGDYLQAIDAGTGKSIRTFGTDGGVDLREGLDRDPATIGRIQSGTPGKVFENLLLLGSATGEGYFSPPGDLRAYDVITGKLAWQFHTVPRPGEFGYETWPKDAWKYIGGTNTWGELSIDARRGIAYFPTGSPTFDYYGADRVGSNLFANCLIALDARTGKRLWHFQTVHHDLWDFDNVSAPQLTTIQHNGQRVDVVALAGKTGYLYVFDRVTGAPIWPIVETPVPTMSEVPGERPWPTQPIPSMPAPFGRQRFTVADLNPYLITPAEREAYRARIAKARNDGPFTPIGFNEVVHMPGNHGGSNWGSTSSNPNDGSVYVITFNVPALMRLLKKGEAPSSGGGGSSTPGMGTFQRECAACHGAQLGGTANAPALLGITGKLKPAELRATIVDGRGQMPAFHQLTAPEVDGLMGLFSFVDTLTGRGGAQGATFAPGPVVDAGPARVRPAPARGAGPAAVAAYPEGVPDVDRLVMDGYGLYPDIINPPYTTLTGYDLNRGAIKWQVGLGDDPRLVEQGIRNTGAAMITVKGSTIVTPTGLLFVNAADRKVHVYDANNGRQLHELPLGANTNGSPSMYEAGGRQFLLVSASGAPPAAADGTPLPPAGPTGLVAFALKR